MKKHPDDYIVQNIIFKRANRQGMGITELAKRIGVSKSQINNWKRNQSQIRMEDAEKCFEALNEQAVERGYLIF